MNGDSFRLEIMTPPQVATWEVRSLLLKDRTGSFGIWKGHCDCLAKLTPSLAHIVDVAGDEHFLAVEGGIFIMQAGTAAIISGEVFESRVVAQLAETIDTTFARRDAAEQAISRMVSGIERSFLKKATLLKQEQL